jgi:hypothetical protein
MHLSSSRKRAATKRGSGRIGVLRFQPRLACAAAWAGGEPKGQPRSPTALSSFADLSREPLVSGLALALFEVLARH